MEREGWSRHLGWWFVSYTSYGKMFLCHIWVLARVMCTYWRLLLMTRTTSQVSYSTSIVWSKRIALDGTFGQIYHYWWQLAKEFLKHHHDAKYYYIYCQHSITWCQYQVKPCQECNKPWFLGPFFYIPIHWFVWFFWGGKDIASFFE
jgi:hypothetical protein